MNVLILYAASTRNASHSSKNWARYYHKCTDRSSCKVRVVLVRFCTLIFENPKTKNFMKICPMGAICSVCTGGQTDRQIDMTEPIVENYPPLVYYVASNDILLLTFRDNMSVGLQWFLELGTDWLSRNTSMNYPYSLRTSPEERSSYSLRFDY